MSRHPEDAEAGKGSPNGHTNNGNGAREKVEPQGSPDASTSRRPKSVVMGMIEDFSPIWFTVSMDTGILGLLLNRLPYQFPHAQSIASAFYVLLILQFLIFGSILILRLILFPKSVVQRALSNFDELCLWAAPAIAWLTLSALTGTQVSPTHWGGHSFTVLAVVLWWIGVAWIIAIGIVIFAVTIRHNPVDGRNLSAGLFLPCVGTATAASTGGIIVAYSYECSASLAVPIIVVCFSLAGWGIFTALLIYTIFTHRLISTGWPEAAKLPQLTILLGPLGQTSAALLVNSYAASTAMDFGQYSRGTFLTSMSASSISATCTLTALLLLGFAYFWALLVLAALGEAAWKRQLSYSLVWWSTIFPMGTINIAWASLSVDLQSVTFSVLATALYVLLVIIWLVNVAWTVYGCVWGKLLIVRTREDLRREEEEAGKVD